MKTWGYALIVVAVLAGLSTLYITGYNAGKQQIITKLQSDRVTVLQDGKRIDENVLAVDDDGLLCLLTDCSDN